MSRRFWKSLPLIFCLFLSSPTPASESQSAYTYKVLAVLDGDTFIATDGNVKFRVRIVAMDAPEKAQAYGQAAKNRLQQLILAKNVRISPVGKGYDLYARVLGHVEVEGQNVAKLLIEEGLAHYYRPSCKDYPLDKRKYNYDPTDYVKAEDEAKLEKRNVWSQTKITLPCKFRHSESSTQKSEEKGWKLWDFVSPEVLF